MLSKVYDEVIYPPQTSTVVRWSLGSDKLFHPTLYNGCNNLSMLGLKLIHIDTCFPKVYLHEFNAKHSQFRILPRYKVKSEGEVVSSCLYIFLSFFL